MITASKILKTLSESLVRVWYDSRNYNIVCQLDNKSDQAQVELELSKASLTGISINRVYLLAGNRVGIELKDEPQDPKSIVEVIAKILSQKGFIVSKS